MKKFFLALVVLFQGVCLLQGQTDTMYVMKAGIVINKQSIKAADVDSIIFYQPDYSADFVPDSAVFAKERPTPTVVRGFMMGETFTQQTCYDAKQWGANVIRLQPHPATYATSKGQTVWDAWPAYLDQLELLVKQAKLAGLKVVIDLHQAPFQNVNFQSAEFWQRSDLEENFCRIWTDIANRFLPYKSTIWAYDIYNEPADISQMPNAPSQWRAIAIKIVKAIRKVDNDVWIVYEPGPYGDALGYRGMQPLPDPHIIYSVHFYSPQADFTHQGVNLTGVTYEQGKLMVKTTYPSIIKGVLWDKNRLITELRYVDEFQARWKIPIYIGEFSVIRWSPIEGSAKWLQDVIDIFEARGWSWSYHSFREWHGWSLEHNEEFWMNGMLNPAPVTYETERAKIIKKAFLKN